MDARPHPSSGKPGRPRRHGRGRRREKESSARGPSNLSTAFAESRQGPCRGRNRHKGRDGHRGPSPASKMLATRRDGQGCLKKAGKSRRSDEPVDKASREAGAIDSPTRCRTLASIIGSMTEVETGGTRGTTTRRVHRLMMSGERCRFQRGEAETGGVARIAKSTHTHEQGRAIESKVGSPCNVTRTRSGGSASSAAAAPFFSFLGGEGSQAKFVEVWCEV